MRFLAREAGTHWLEWERLAALCEQAGLTSVQAEAARLVAGGYPLRQLAAALSARIGGRLNYPQAYHAARQAGIRIRRSRPDLAGLQRQEAVELLVCVRNVKPSRPGLCIYPEKWGTYDREPVRFRSRLMGEVPDDLIRHPLRFLRELPRLLAASTAGD